MYATATVILETLGYKVKNAWNPPTRPPHPVEKKRPDTKIKEASPASVILQTDADTDALKQIRKHVLERLLDWPHVASLSTNYCHSA